MALVWNYQGLKAGKRIHYANELTLHFSTFHQDRTPVEITLTNTTTMGKMRAEKVGKTWRITFKPSEATPLKPTLEQLVFFKQKMLTALKSHPWNEKKELEREFQDSLNSEIKRIKRRIEERRSKSQDPKQLHMSQLLAIKNRRPK